MIRALRSSFFRFVRTGLFVKVIIFSLLLCMFTVFETCILDMMMISFGRPRFFDNGFIILNLSKLNYVTPFAIAVFCSVYTGSDVSERTVNNRIATGIPRICIYFADLIISVFAAVLSAGISLLFYYVFAKNVPVKESIKINWDVLRVTGSLMIVFAGFTAFFVMLQYLFSKKLIAVIISLMFIPVFMIATSSAGFVLEEPYRTYVMTDAESETYEWRINKDYVGGTARKILTIFYETSPFNSENVADEKIIVRKTAAAGTAVLLTTAAGLAAVKRKEYQ